MQVLRHFSTLLLACALAFVPLVSTAADNDASATGSPSSGVSANPYGALPVTGSATAPGGSTNGIPATLPAGMPAGLPTSAPIAAPPSAPVAVPEIRTTTPAGFDYNANLRSDVFGANLFSGAFARQGATQFNPDYLIAVGDQIQVRLWGAFYYDSAIAVDPQGNIFIPNVGPVRVLGVRNQDLQQLVSGALGRVFRTNVNSYASLAAAQPVRIFVGGNVPRPGLYSGTSMDSLLHYLDQAGGIDLERGTFLAVQVKRGAAVRATVNLYDFLLRGVMPMIQLADGDVIFVPPRQQTVRVTGLAENSKRFEFPPGPRTVADLVALAKPLPAATHVRVVRNTGALKNVEYYPIEEAGRVPLQNGDDVEFTADKKPGTITVRVQGEHLSAQEYVLPYGTRLGELLKHVQYSERSDVESVQLFRQSVRDRQKAMLATSLRSLETTALTARSGTSDEARLRKDEADLLLRWVERAKNVEPSGQVVIAGNAARGDLLLENGDILNVPTRDGLVLVSGEVLFPNAIAFESGMGVEDYIRKAGGFTQNADSARVVVARRDGTFVDAGDGSRGFGESEIRVRSGDELLVLPKIDVKSRQIWKDLSQIIFQIAVSAKVVLGL